MFFLISVDLLINNVLVIDCQMVNFLFALQRIETPLEIGFI
jgi:hypothetical protein